MGRGLSDMQVAALRMGYESKLRGERYTANGHRQPQVFLWEFLSAWYGWPVTSKSADGWHFSSSDIREARYKAGKSAAARTLTRLEERGLISRTSKTGAGYGYDLTQEGESVARTLNG